MAMIRSRSIWLAALPAFLTLPAPPVLAGTVQIDVGTVSAHANGADLSVEAKDATLGEILDALAVRFEFRVDGAAAGRGRSTTSGRWTGSLDHVLGRLLKSTGHVVVHDDKAPGGISRVLVLDRAPVGVAGATQAPDHPGTDAPVVSAATPRLPAWAGAGRAGTSTSSRQPSLQ